MYARPTSGPHPPCTSMGNSVPIHCIPPCAMALIESYCEDLWVGSVLGDDVDSFAASHGRMSLPALRISWSKVVSVKILGCEEVITLANPRRTSRANVVCLENHATEDRIFTVHCPDSGQCLGAVSDDLWLSWRRWSRVNGSLVLELGKKGVIVVRPDYRGRGILSCHSQDPADVVAVADRLVLQARLEQTTMTLLACRDDGDKVIGSLPLGNWTMKTPSREDDVLMAAHFTDLPGQGLFPDRAVCVFQNMDVVLMSHGMPPQTVGRLFGNGAGGGRRVMGVECGSVMIRESADRFVFVMVATMPLGAADFTFAARFSVRSFGFSVIDSWSSRSDFDSMGFVEHATNGCCNLSEIVTDIRCSLIILRLRNSRTGARILILDRSSLRILGSRVAQNQSNCHHFAGLCSIAKLVRDPGVSALAEKIHHVKERRMRDTTRSLSANGWMDG